MPQRPQWARAVMVSKQAVTPASKSPHTVCPAAQPVAQRPSAHTWPAPQTMAQPPQLKRSLVMSTQRALHWIDPGPQAPRRQRPRMQE